jgi:hypothetical protein
MHKLESELLDMCTHNIEKVYATHPVGSIHRAVLVKRGKVIADAFNHTGSRHSGAGHSTFTIHAERNVVKQLGDLSQIRGADMYVIRIYRVNLRSKIQPAAMSFVKYTADTECTHQREHFKGSKPCSECSIFLNKCLRQYGLRNIYYTE